MRRESKGKKEMRKVTEDKQGCYRGSTLAVLSCVKPPMCSRAELPFQAEQGRVYVPRKEGEWGTGPQCAVSLAVGTLQCPITLQGRPACALRPGVLPGVTAQRSPAAHFVDKG